MIRTLLLLASLSLLNAQQPNANQLLNDAQASLKRLPGVTMTVQARQRIEAEGIPRRDDQGTVTKIAMKHPKSRIEIQAGPASVLLINDGVSTYTYSTAENSYTKQPYREQAATPNPLNMLAGIGKGETTVTGSETVTIGGRKWDCWVVQGHYDLGPQANGITAADVRFLISKQHNVQLMSMIALTIPKNPQLPTGGKQVQETVVTEFNPGVALNDNMFVFSPPPGSKQATRPDQGTPAPKPAAKLPASKAPAPAKKP